MNKKQANSLFYYIDGNIFWRQERKGAQKDSVAGSKNVEGYKKVCVDGKFYQVHRVIFLMTYGYLPKMIDHVDFDKQNNAIDNLRSCSHSENLINAPKHKRNTSGEKGVTWNSNSKKWLVYISTPTKSKRYFGGHHDFELAQLIAIEARIKYQGEFCNNN